MALGADNILMTKMGQLSPIDPSIDSPLAPTAPIPGIDIYLKSWREI